MSIRGMLEKLIVLVVLFVVIFGGAIKGSWDNRGIQKEIDIALVSLSEKDLVFKPKNHGLDILPIGLSLTDHEVYSMLRQTGDKNGIFTFGYSDVGIYTMSSQSVDGIQYLVNSYLEGYQPFQVDNVMMPLFILSQRKSYLLDSKQYPGRTDVWQSSRQAFFYSRGDCEDHAIVLADWLIEMGEDARVVIGDIDGGGHAWVVLFKNGKEYLLEATKKSGLTRTKPYPVAVLYTNYHPKFMFNREYFWANNGSKYTTNYASEHWEKKSQYRINS